MSKSSNNAGYPYFLVPGEHLLPAYYRKLNRCFFMLSPLIFLANEFLVRSDLADYKKAPDALWSIIALALNAQTPMDRSPSVLVAMVLFAACLAINFSLLPKWGRRPSKTGMKAGLPPKDGYGNAYFGIFNPIDKNAFMFWNSVLVPASFLFASFIPCMFINLLRSLP